MFKKRIKAVPLLLVLLSPLAQSLTDPTRPPGFGGAASKKVHFHLNSVLLSDERKVAIVNGQSVVEGDMVDGAKVLLIAKDLVKLDKAGELIVLKTKRASIRRKK